MTLRFILARCAAVAALALGATSAFALTLDAAGRITDWGITPFSNADGIGNWGNGAPPTPSGVNGIDRGTVGGLTYAEGNNAAPVDYSSFYPAGTTEYVPAPSTTANGEKFDHEFLGWRVSGGNLQVLGITSVDFINGGLHNGVRFRAGDLFINADGNAGTGVSGYDYAAAANPGAAGYTSDRNDPLHPADDNPTWTHPVNGLYSLDSTADIHGITNEGGFGNFPAIAGPNNPFAVRQGADLVAGGLSNFSYTSFNHGNQWGADENNTFILEWTISLASLGNVDLSRLTLHWGTECGNDFLDTPPAIPEPATLSLLGLGLASLGLLRRRRVAA